MFPASSPCSYADRSKSLSARLGMNLSLPGVLLSALVALPAAGDPGSAPGGGSRRLPGDGLLPLVAVEVGGQSAGLFRPLLVAEGVKGEEGEGRAESSDIITSSSLWPKGKVLLIFSPVALLLFRTPLALRPDDDDDEDDEVTFGVESGPADVITGRDMDRNEVNRGQKKEDFFRAEKM